MTLLELIIATAILLILSSAALPNFRYKVVEQRESELRRRHLMEIRNAIDRYKDLADQGKVRVAAGTEGYPHDLETLVKGVNIGAGTQEKVRFLRRIPKDPMTGKTDWSLCAIQDEAACTRWGGNNVFDVHSRSQVTALDGSRYSDG